MTAEGLQETPTRRADARRNIERIVLAAADCLARDPDASMADIAAEAGLGRVTLYGHFKSRSDLVQIVVERALEAANESLRDLDLSGDPATALARLVAATWDVTARFGTLLIAAERVLPPARLRELHHGELEDRVRSFIAHAQSVGAFRTDLPTDWLVATFHAVIHTAPNEVQLGHVGEDETADIITATLLGVLSVPPARRRRRR